MANKNRRNRGKSFHRFEAIFYPILEQGSLQFHLTDSVAGPATLAPVKTVRGESQCNTPASQVSAELL